jgi:hypothetical protein
MKVHDLTRSSIKLGLRRVVFLNLLAVCSMSARLLAQEYQSDPIDDKVAMRNRTISPPTPTSSWTTSTTITFRP